MTPPLVLYIACFALTFSALATLPFIRRRRAGASLRLSVEPMAIVFTLMFAPPAFMSMGEHITFGMVAPGAFVLLFGATQWWMLAYGGAALARRLGLPGWSGAFLALAGLIVLSILTEAGYLFVSSWLLPPLTAALAAWRAATHPDPQLASLVR